MTEDEAWHLEIWTVFFILQCVCWFFGILRFCQSLANAGNKSSWKAPVPSPFQHQARLGIQYLFLSTPNLQQPRSSFGFSILSLMTLSSVLFAFPSDLFPIFFLAHLCFLPVLQLPPHQSTMVVGNGEEARTLLGRGAQASTGNTPLLLFRTAGASQEHGFHFRRCWAPASSGAEHVRPFFREFIWCQPSTQLGLTCSLCSTRHCKLAKHFCWKLSKSQKSSQYRYQARKISTH